MGNVAEVIITGAGKPGPFSGRSCGGQRRRAWAGTLNQTCCARGQAKTQASPF